LWDAYNIQDRANEAAIIVLTSSSEYIRISDGRAAAAFFPIECFEQTSL
jgi:hypothetical protein